MISPLIVGVLNVTPDSFSDGGSYLTPSAAVERAMEMRDDGADYVEIGGESTRPGSEPVAFDIEWKRVEPVLKKLASEIPISIDTYKAEVAKRALDYGAQMVNDISALRADPEMASVVAKHRAKLVLMYSKEPPNRPHATDSERPFRNVVTEISEFLAERVRHATSRGVHQSEIILDPGSGKFVSANPELSWEILRKIAELRKLGCALMIGASRKGFMSVLRDEDSAEARDPISALLAVHASLSGVGYIRTHNPRMTKEFLSVWQKLSAAD